jgi:hypothetical protein
MEAGDTTLCLEANSRRHSTSFPNLLCTTRIGFRSSPRVPREISVWMTDASSSVRMPFFFLEVKIGDMQLKPGDILGGDFWPEPVRVLTVQDSGPRIKIEAVGLRTQQFFPRILSHGDLGRVRVSAETGRDFTGRAEVFFLAVEGHRVRYAYQFDPLYASTYRR